MIATLPRLGEVGERFLPTPTRVPTRPHLRKSGIAADRPTALSHGAREHSDVAGARPRPQQWPPVTAPSTAPLLASSWCVCFRSCSTPSNHQMSISRDGVGKRGVRQRPRLAQFGMDGGCAGLRRDGTKVGGEGMPAQNVAVRTGLEDELALLAGHLRRRLGGCRLAYSSSYPSRSRCSRLAVGHPDTSAFRRAALISALDRT